MSFKNYLLVLLCCLLQECRSRHVSVSLKLSLALSDKHPALSPDMLQQCMRETEISMTEMHRFRESLISDEPELIVNSNEDVVVEMQRNEISDGETDADDIDAEDIVNNQYSTVGDFDSSSLIPLNERNEQSLHCFAHCLYEKMGLVKYDIFKEQELFNKLFALIIEREKTPVKECMQLESDKKCETIYKMQLCYGRLKSMDAERRIREILERDVVEEDDLEQALGDMNMELHRTENEIDHE